MDLSSIGRNIRKRRLEKGLKQDELAEMIDVSQNYIGMIERGEKIPALDTFIAIVNALEISSDVILADVINTGFSVKTTMLQDKIMELPHDKQILILEIVKVITELSISK